MLTLIDKLLEKPYCVIDFLPLQIPKDGNIDFFDDVEQYFLSSPEIDDLAGKFSRIILKTLCYFDFEMIIEEEVQANNCKTVSNTVLAVVKKQKGSVSFLLLKEETLIQLTGGQLTITVYNSSSKVQKVLEPLAIAEGLFWWKSQV